MFSIRALPALVIVPLIIRNLPESTREVREVETEERASEGPGFGALKTLFSGGCLLATLAYWVASFMGLLLVYGLNQWLP